MARTDPQLNLRLPSELKDKLEESAKKSMRSLNAETVARLQASFDDRGSENINFSSLRRLLDRLDTEEKVIEASTFLEAKKK